MDLTEAAAAAAADTGGRGRGRRGGAGGSGRGRGRGRGRSDNAADAQLASPGEDEDDRLSGGHSSSADSKLLPDDPGPNAIKVSATSRVSGVAGKIAHTVRDGALPTVMTAGRGSINQGVKSIAVARQYLAESGADVCFSATFRDDNHSRNLLALQVHTGSPAALQPAGELVDVRVSSKSRHAKVGGAIAARLREGKQVHVTCIGVIAVANACMALGHAKFYLAKDALDVKVFPEFVEVAKEDRQLNAVKLVCCCDTLLPPLDALHL